MFEVKNLIGNTYYYEAFTNVGIYRINSNEAVLIDACDHPRMVKSLDRFLEEMGLRVNTVIDTHCHMDHICGNSYFKNKYACRLLSTKLEHPFIYKTDLESGFYYSGLTMNKALYATEPSETEIINDSNIPEGLEIISLPGHSFEMIGVRTSDDVLFLADSVLSKNTWENHKLPFFRDVNKAIETLEGVKDMKAKLFVPSHNEVVEDIKELAIYNTEKLKEKKEMIYELCEGKSFEGVFALIMEKDKLNIKTPNYSMYAVMVRNYLQSLIDDGRIRSVFEDNLMVYRKK